jgi:hypothetical protein
VEPCPRIKVAGEIGWLSKWGCAYDNLVAVPVHDNEAKSRTNSDRGRALRLEKSEARVLSAIRREAKGRSVTVHRGDRARDYLLTRKSRSWRRGVDGESADSQANDEGDSYDGTTEGRFGGRIPVLSDLSHETSSVGRTDHSDG